MTSWEDDLPVVDSRTLPPDPQFLEAIGLNHAFESAVADLVDNSIDAGAKHVLVRFVRRSDGLIGLYVVDDGKGMGEDEIDKAMTIGKRRDYAAGDLGHFGIGLKAASLGQASKLSVFSKRSDQQPVGRRWVVKQASSRFDCDVLDADYSAQLIARDWGVIGNANSGTVVRWDDVRVFPKARSQSVANSFLEETLLKVRQHLGLVFHRLLEQDRFRLVVDTEDVEADEVGPPFFVEPIDPFGYLRAGHHAYPETLALTVDESDLILNCHIWPGRSQLPEFRLPGGRPDVFQGFYFYKAGRLLQIGGWNGVTHGEKHYQLARIAIDIDGAPKHLFTMNPEKTKLDAHQEFVAAVRETTGPEDFSFNRYLNDAKQTFKEAQKRDRSRRKVFEPGTGLHSRVRRAITRELDFLPGEDPIEIRWTRFDTSVFFDIDRDQGVIWLNKRYRSVINRGRSGSLSDAPLVKTLLYLLVEDLFHGAFLGSKDKDNIELWEAILTAAAETELRFE
jgi:hypothetical protein